MHGSRKSHVAGLSVYLPSQERLILSPEPPPPPSLLKLNRVITIIIITLRAISQRRAEAGRERLKVRELGGRSAGRYEDNHWSRGKRPETRKGC